VFVCLSACLFICAHHGPRMSLHYNGRNGYEREEEDDSPFNVPLFWILVLFSRKS